MAQHKKDRKRSLAVFSYSRMRIFSVFIYFLNLMSICDNFELGFKKSYFLFLSTLKTKICNTEIISQIVCKKR